MTDSPRLVVDDVTVTFAGLRALTSVSFTVEPGQIHALIGPNGAGKSTCLNVISGVYRAADGQVLLGAQRIDTLRPHAIAALGIGRGFQNVKLAHSTTVAQYLMTGRYHLMRAGVVSTALGLPHARREWRSHRTRVEEIAAYMGIGHLMSLPAGSLAYGDQKRVDIARAISMEPSVLVLDEPAAGLDDAETRAMTRTIRDLRAALDISVLLVEHDMGLVMSLSDQVTVLDFGKLIATGTPEQVRSNPHVVEAYLGRSAASLPDIAAPREQSIQDQIEEDNR